jgi:hypothetical protein
VVVGGVAIPPHFGAYSWRYQDADRLRSRRDDMRDDDRWPEDPDSVQPTRRSVDFAFVGVAAFAAALSFVPAAVVAADLAFASVKREAAKIEKKLDKAIPRLTGHSTRS